MTLKTTGGFADHKTNTEFYDRNPLTVDKYYEDDIAPHGALQRFTYTVPVNRKAEVGSVVTTAVVTTAATVVAGAYCVIRKFLNDIVIAKSRMYKNTIGDIVHDSKGKSVVLLAGERIDGLTSNTNTGGTILWILALCVLEFDA